MQVYLDNSATTRPLNVVMEAVTTCMGERYHNPSALYAPAMVAEKELEGVRKTVAASLKAQPGEVVFTSGGTEGNNLAIMGRMACERKKGTILCSAAEHPAVKNACLEAGALYGHAVKEIPLTSRGTIDLVALEGLLDASVRLICVMHVCNETGAIMPLAEVAKLRDKLAPEAALHVDGVQGYLRYSISLGEAGIQSYGISGHKIHGPKGVGALICQKGHKLRPMLVGGGQEAGLRSGTENTPGVAGLRVAIEAYPADASTHMAGLKSHLLEALRDRGTEYTVLGPPAGEPDSAGHILSIAFPPVRGETLVHALEAEGILIGTGSACSSKKRKHSAVLTAMKTPPALMDSMVRISFSPLNTLEEASCAAETIARQVELLKPFARR